MPLFGQALLLHALAVSKQKREMIDKLAGEVEGQLHLDANMAFANENLGDDYAVDKTANFFGRVWVSKTAPANRPPALIRVPDVETVPHRTVEIPLVTSDPDGQALTLTVDPPVRFARIVDKPGGARVLEIRPDERDSRACPYKVTVLATDDGTPALSDAMTVQVLVRY